MQGRTGSSRLRCGMASMLLQRAGRREAQSCGACRIPALPARAPPRGAAARRSLDSLPRQKVRHDSHCRHSPVRAPLSRGRRARHRQERPAAPRGVRQPQDPRPAAARLRDRQGQRARRGAAVGRPDHRRPAAMHPRIPRARRGRRGAAHPRPAREAAAAGARFQRCGDRQACRISPADSPSRWRAASRSSSPASRIPARPSGTGRSRCSTC